MAVTLGDRPLPLRDRESWPAAQICFPQAVDGSSAVPERISGGRAPEIHKPFPCASTEAPHVLPRLSTALSTGPIDPGCGSVLASHAGLPGRRQPSLRGRGRSASKGTTGLTPSGSPRGTHPPSAIISLYRGSPPPFPAIPPTAPPRRCGVSRMSEHHVTLERMRPALKPGLLAVWRNRDTVQIGIDPRRAIALTGMRGAAVLLGLLDGSRDLAQILAAASEAGISVEAADRVITLLAVGGALHDFPVTAYRAMPHGLRTRLAPELATAALAHGDADGGARILARRQGACVRVEGMSRVGLCIASFLTASGIGMVVSTGRPAGLVAGPRPPPAAGPPAPAHVPPPAGPSAPAGEPAPG